MRTGKKRVFGSTGWATTVTTDDGEVLRVTLTRGKWAGFRTPKGQNVYEWNAWVSGRGWVQRFSCRRVDSARALAMIALRHESRAVAAP